MFCRQCGTRMEDTARFCPACGQQTDIGTQPVYAPPAPAPVQAQPVYAPPVQAQPVHTPPVQAQPVYVPPAPSPVQPLAPSPAGKTGGGSGTIGYVFYGVLFLVSMFLLILAGIPFKWAICVFLLFVVFGLVLALAVRKGASGLPRIMAFLIPLFVVGVTLVAAAFGWLGWTRVAPGPGPGPGPGLQATATPAPVGVDSSAVSVGVSLDDLGNITNGQYYFDDGNSVYYSSFDTANAAHIYRKDRSTGATDSIFDGFGWSLVVDEGWLYFSGNAGAAIDGTYHLFRIHTDGTGIETLDSRYCFGMSLYQKWLYYCVRESDATVSIVRMDLDGMNPQTLVTGASGFAFVFENRLFYMDGTGAVVSAAPDGTGSKQVLAAPVSQFVIGNGHIFYLDSGNNIWRSGVDGSKPMRIRAASAEGTVLALNSYQNTLFFADYAEKTAEGRAAWYYNVRSIQDDGSGEKNLYEGISNGTWMNLVGGRLYVLDYAADADNGIWTAVVGSLSFSGGSASELPRPTP